MARGASFSEGVPHGDFYVPGTSVTTGSLAYLRRDSASADPTRRLIARDPTFRNLYAARALAAVPRLLGAVDRNPFRATHGCFDREHWHYRASCFPSEMHQEAVLPLALVCVTRMPGNRWHGDRRVRELAIYAHILSSKR